MTKSELFNPSNILDKRVFENFRRRTRVAKILPDIDNNSSYYSNGNKYIEKIKNDHLVLEGLINHIYLLPEKIEILQQYSAIPEGSNANNYLVKNNKVNKQYTVKICISRIK